MEIWYNTDIQNNQVDNIASWDVRRAIVDYLK